MKKLRFSWTVLRLVLPLYLNVMQISLRDMSSLYFRAEDSRMKKFRNWLDGENGNDNGVFYSESI